MSHGRARRGISKDALLAQLLYEWFHILGAAHFYMIHFENRSQPMFIAPLCYGLAFWLRAPEIASRYPPFQRIIIFHIFDGLLINFGGWGYPFSDTATSTVPKSSSSLAQVCSEELALEAEVERTLQCLAVATTPKKKGG